jgi:hypothetical protein
VCWYTNVRLLDKDQLFLSHGNGLVGVYARASIIVGNMMGFPISFTPSLNLLPVMLGNVIQLLQPSERVGATTN